MILPEVLGEARTFTDASTTLARTGAGTAGGSGCVGSRIAVGTAVFGGSVGTAALVGVAVGPPTKPKRARPPTNNSMAQNKRTTAPMANGSQSRLGPPSG